MQITSCEFEQVKIVDADGRIVPLGAPGELCVRGYLTMCGYYGDKAKTEMLIKPTNWLHTGFPTNQALIKKYCVSVIKNLILRDLMTMAETGHGSIVGRIKDTIIRGGENIYPKEVEDYIHSHPKVLEVQVFGVPDYRMGEEVAAWILLKDGVTLTEGEIRDFCKGKVWLHC